MATGTPNWIDLSTANVDAAREFYSTLFGWTFESTETPLGTYHLASASHGQVAGLMAQSPDMADGPSFWTLFFATDAVDETVSKICNAGGTSLHPAIDLPDGTRVIAMKDTTGAMFGLTSGSSDDPFLSQTPGSVGWVELMTRTPAESNEFYEEVFAWTTATELTDQGVVYTVYTQGEHPVAGMIETPKHLPTGVPDNWSVYFSVADCAASEAAAVRLGATVLLPTTPTPIGPFAVLADPQGAVFQICKFAPEA